jgi:hypothetical protein
LKNEINLRNRIQKVTDWGLGAKKVWDKTFSIPNLPTNPVELKIIFLMFQYRF